MSQRNYYMVIGMDWSTARAVTAQFATIMKDVIPNVTFIKSEDSALMFQQVRDHLEALKGRLDPATNHIFSDNPNPHKSKHWQNHILKINSEIAEIEQFLKDYNETEYFANQRKSNFL